MVAKDYPGQAQKANDLMTYPTLFMGLGNFISMPIAEVMGRRPVFLTSIVVLIIGGIWCATSQSLASHIAGRNIMSLAAGQSEALSPMIIQEVHFVHERGRKLGWFIFIQNFTVGVFFFSETYMVSSWGWRWWYAFFTIFNAAVLAASFFLATETLYNRPVGALTGDVGTEGGHKLSETVEQSGVRSAYGTLLRPDVYGPRTWRNDLKLWHKLGKWSTVPQFYVDFFKGLCHPILFWLLLLNGAYLGLYIFQASTFATILMSPPFLISFNNLGYVQGAQILVCIAFLPILGYGSDFVIRTLSRRNNGEYKPEYRLILLSVPATVTLVCAIIYGQAAQYPEKWHWAAVAVPYNVIFFGFLGANIVGITYAVDSFPAKAAPVLVVICAGRGLASFGVSYAVLPSISSVGYDGTMNIVGGLCSGLAVLTIPMYFCGPYLRKIGQKYYGLSNADRSE
jgi:hypothetical protein